MPADIQTLYAAPERRPSLHRSPTGRSRHIPIHDYPVHFSGTGSEYFRIWIVNLLLVIVTFGIYWPWARRRKLQYLYHCTWVDGHAFDFHGNPRSMLRGSLLAGVLLAVYGMGNRVAGGASAVLIALLMVALFPPLFRGSQRFRLANTSWRGLRFHFTGTTGEAYRALLVPLLWLLLPGPLLAWGLDIDLSQLDRRGTLRTGTHAVVYQAWMLGSGVLFSLALPYFYWRYKRDQQGHIRYGQEEMEYRATAADYYRLLASGVGVFVALFLAGLLLVAGGAALKRLVFGSGHASFGMMLALSLLGSIAGFLLALLVGRHWFKVRLYNLQWSRTGNRHLRLRTTLSLGRYLLLQFKNYLLIGLTLGLYWPYAVMATRRLVLESTVLRARMPLERLHGSSRDGDNDAMGDAAMEFVNFDFGL